MKLNFNSVRHITHAVPPAQINAAYAISTVPILYRGLLYSAQNIVKKDPGRAKQKSLATAGANFTKPGAQNKGDLCNCNSRAFHE